MAIGLLILVLIVGTRIYGARRWLGLLVGLLGVAALVGILNGVVTFLLGVIICRHFPQESLGLLGLLIGIEMLFNGWTWIMLSLAIRKIPVKNAA